MTVQSTEGLGKMKFTKTETEYNMKSIKFLLLTITTMFIVIAGLMIVLGISVYSHYHNFVFFLDSGTGFVFTPSVLCVLLGLVLMVITLFGFFGTLKQSTCMVNLYAVSLFTLFIVKLVVVIIAFTMDGNSLYDYISVPVSKYADDVEIQNELDSLQYSLNCCGSTSFLEYLDVPFTDSHQTMPYSDVMNGSYMTMVVPQSCCSISLDGEGCDLVRHRGCKEALTDLVLQNAGVIGVLGTSVMFIEALGIIFALLLAKCIRKNKSERALLEWKLKEKMIWARQQERRQEEMKADIENSVYITHPESSVA